MKNSILISALILLVFSCSKDDDPQPIPEKVATIYASGNGVTTLGIEIARYWENGVSHDLSNGINDAGTSGIVVTNNGDIYVSGNEWNTTNAVPKYWKNGTPYNLPTTHPNTIQTPTSMYTTDIAVAGNDVYVTGDEMLDNGNYIATYWKNGEENYLSNPTNDTRTSAITVANNKVYVAGYEKNGSIRTAILWIDGIQTNVTTGATDAFISDIVLVGTKIYLAGVAKNGANPFACYWMKDTAISGSSFIFYPLSAALTPAITYSATAIGTDVYFSGNEGNDAKYWKVNDVGTKTETVLLNGPNVSTRSIFGFGQDNYVITIDGSGNKYWKNGSQITNLPALASGNYITNVCVIQK